MLYEDLIIESIQHYGTDVYYLPRTIANRDRTLNEATESQFNDAWMVEVYVEDIEGFGGAGDLMQKFGLEIRDEVTLIVAKRQWNKWVGSKTTAAIDRPMEGDLIYLPFSKSYFEIMHVEHEQPFYQLKNLPVYKMKCSLFEYNDEVFNTRNKEVDAIKYKFAKRTTMQVHSVTGSFKIGERFTQTIALDPQIDISGEIVSWNPALGMIEVIDIATSSGQFGRYQEEYGEFKENEYASGATTGAKCIIGTIFGLETETSGVGADNLNVDQDSQSYEFEKFGDDIISFEETNPFGEP